MFSTSSPLGKFLSKLLDLFLLQIYFLLTSIPVFTIGAGLTAMFTVCRRIQDEEHVSVTGQYFSAFKVSFRQSTAAWLLMGLSGALLVLSVRYYSQLESTWRVLPIGVACLLLVIDIALFIYFFPLTAWFDNSLKQHFRNAAVLAVYHWKTTLLTALLYAFVFLAAVRAVPFLLLISVSGCAFYANMLLRNVFVQHDAEVNPVRNEENEELTEKSDL